MRFKNFLNEKEAKEGKTTTDHDHYHKYKVDDNGIGETTSTEVTKNPKHEIKDHVHDIDNWKVLDSGDGEHKHKHEINTHHKEKEEY